MRVSRRKAQENRAAVLDAAARLFRERGLDGAGVAEVSREAGLTHGGFYGQFTGKDDLAAQALSRAFEATLGVWAGLTAARPSEQAFAAIAAAYLSDRHLASPGHGCPVPALAAEAGRKGGVVQAAFTCGVRDLLDALARAAPGATEAARRAQAARLLAGLAGAVLIARAVDDPELAHEVLQAAQAGLPAHRDGPGEAAPVSDPPA